ncbi:MAG TPA: tetratricopeptide repeat protein [Terracidiphilus sp.]|jgi:tetratricopeptide (TPR) repeat protein
MNSVLLKASEAMRGARYQEAAEILQTPSHQECDARVSLLLAGAFEAQGDLSKAEQTLLQAHSKWPFNSSVAASLAREYMSRGQVKEAGGALLHFSATPSSPLQEMEIGVVVFIANHQLISAHQVAETAWKAYPSEQTALMLANTLQLQGRFKEVITLLGAQREVYGKSPAFLITLAESEYDSILYDAARDDLQRALAIDPASYQAHYLLGNSLYKLGNVDQAIAEYRRSAELNSNQARVHFQLALALQSKRDQAAAEQELERAIAVDGHFAPALIDLAKIRISENRVSDAVAQLNVAVEDNPRSEQAYFLLAKAYAQLGDKKKSDEMAKRLVTVRNSNWKGSGSQEGSQSGGDDHTIH